MKVDLSPRAAGKTTRLIEWLKADPQRVMITFSHDEENRLKREYPDVSNRIVDWESYRRGKTKGTWIKEVAIDNADIVLQSLVGDPIKHISISEYD